MQSLRLIRTGIPNLNHLLGGGIPAFSLNIIAGQPGTGKTILAHQITNHHIHSNPEARALLLTTLSEPMLKMIRYIQEFTFFNSEEFGERVVFQDIGPYIRKHSLQETAVHIDELVSEFKPEILIIDSFKAIRDLAASDSEYRRFSYDLSIRLAAARCTSFLVGEYDASEIAEGTEFAVADGIIYLDIHRSSEEATRRIWVRKMRGQPANLTQAPFIITRDGIRVLGAFLALDLEETLPSSDTPVPMGIEGLDLLLRGGLLPARCCLLSGISGSGKTTLALNFLVQGALEGRRGLIFSFEESPDPLHRLAASFGWDLEALEEEGLIKVAYIPQTEIRVDEHFEWMMEEVASFRPERVVVDSFSVFLYRVKDEAVQREKTFQLAAVIRAAKAQGLLISDIPTAEPGRLSRFGVEETVLDGTLVVSSIIEGLNRRRYIEVVKMRGVKNIPGRHRMEITDKGIVVFYSAPEDRSAITAPAPISFEPVEGLIRGNIRYGSAWLVRGAPGVGKSTMAFQFAIQALRRKEAVLYVAIDAPPQEIIIALENLSFLPEPYLETGQLVIADAYTGSEGSFDLTDPESLLFGISRLVKKMPKPMVLLLDSLSPVALGYQEDDFVSLVHKKNRLFSRPDVGIFDCLLSGALEGNRLYSLINAYDVVVDLYVPDWGEMKFAGNTGYRALQLSKVRGANADSRPYPYTISATDGLVVRKDYYQDQ